jgi:chromosome segregation ATPase
MEEDDYTLMSSKEVSELKQDVDYLKKNPLGGTKSGKSLQESIEKLNDNIQELIEIFKEASEMTKSEEREADIIIKRIQPIEQKMDELADQNQKIAKGILAVADMVSAREEQRPQPRPQPQQQMQPRPMMQPPMPRPMSSPMPSQPRLPPMSNIPPPSMNTSMQSLGLPAPPKPEKKKLLGFIKT